MDGLPSEARKALLRYTSSVVACYGGWKATEGILLYVNPNLGAFLDGLPSVALNVCEERRMEAGGIEPPSESIQP